MKRLFSPLILLVIQNQRQVKSYDQRSCLCSWTRWNLLSAVSSSLCPPLHIFTGNNHIFQIHGEGPSSSSSEKLHHPIPLNSLIRGVDFAGLTLREKGCESMLHLAVKTSAWDAPLRGCHGMRRATLGSRKPSSVWIMRIRSALLSVGLAQFMKKSATWPR